MGRRRQTLSAGAAAEARAFLRRSPGATLRELAWHLRMTWDLEAHDWCTPKLLSVSTLRVLLERAGIEHRRGGDHAAA